MNDTIAQLAADRLNHIAGELAAAGITPRIAIEMKFFLQDAQGKTIRPDKQAMERLNQALIRRGYHAIIRKQPAASGFNDMLEANFDPYRGTENLTQAQRADMALLAPQESERFKTEVNEIVAEVFADKAVQVNMKPRPFSEDRLMTTLGITDANSMHINVSLLNERGENLLAQSPQLLKNARQWLTAVQAEGMLAYFPGKESFDRQAANICSPGRKAMEVRMKPSAKQSAGLLAATVASGIGCSVAGVESWAFVPLIATQACMAYAAGVKGSGGSYSLRRESDPIKKAIGRLPMTGMLKITRSADETRIEDRLAAPDAHAGLCSAVVLGALSAAIKGPDGSIDLWDNDRLHQSKGKKSPPKGDLLKTGGDGLYVHIKPNPPPVIKNRRFARNLQQAQERFAQSPLMPAILGEELFAAVVSQSPAVQPAGRA